eukprot:390741_1
MSDNNQATDLLQELATEQIVESSIFITPSVTQKVAQYSNNTILQYSEMEDSQANNQSIVELTAILVIGFIRNIIKQCINDINTICIQYYGKYYPILFKINKNSLTQYLDDRYIIKFDDSRKRFECTNMETGNVHLITSGNRRGNKFALAVSDAVDTSNYLYSKSKMNNYDINTMTNRGPIFWICHPCTFTNRKQDLTCDVCGLRKKFDYYHWTSFDRTIWNLFIRNRLYDDTKDINHETQQIWKLIEFLFVIRYAKGYMVPTVIFHGNELEIKESTKIIFKEDAFKDFDFVKDCNASITEFGDGKSVKSLNCKCFIVGDWTRKNDNAELHQIIFSIAKVDNAIKINIDSTIVAVIEPNY